jgi:hypothetical protein
VDVCPQNMVANNKLLYCQFVDKLLTSTSFNLSQGTPTSDNILGHMPSLLFVAFLMESVHLYRKKRLYATQNVKDLLVKEGLVPDQLDFDNKKLPLYLFDNTDYETRYPQQW